MAEIGVSVVVPAYNAAATIGRTLESARNQTHRNLEIIVVDDGSRDDTAAIVARHAAADDRISLYRIPNSGVAAARNIGITKASHALIAPLDADDLWHPQKIALQVAALAGATPDTALVYCWFAVIDGDDRIVTYGPAEREQGDVLQRMCLGNLVGNGSVPLIRKEALLAIGGYDPGLRSASAQGCEDLSLYLRLAEAYRFCVVPHFLVGYRETRASMSSDGRQMLRSFDLVMGPAGLRHPTFAATFALGRRHMTRWLLDRAARYGGWRAARLIMQERSASRPVGRMRDLLRVWRVMLLPRDLGALLQRKCFDDLPSIHP